MDEQTFNEFVHDIRGEIQVAMGAAELALGRCEPNSIEELLETTLKSLQHAAELLLEVSEGSARPS